MKLIQCLSKLKILVHAKSESIFLCVDEILYIKAHENYAFVTLLEKGELMVSHSIKDFESLLSQNGFVRCHKSYLVHMAHVEKWSYQGKSSLTFPNGESVPVSREGARKLREVLESY